MQELSPANVAFILSQIGIFLNNQRVRKESAKVGVKIALREYARARVRDMATKRAGHFVVLLDGGDEICEPLRPHGLGVMGKQGDEWRAGGRYC